MGDTETTITNDTPSSTPLSDSPPIISLTLPIATKLTLSNYLTWKSQILPMIHGYSLTSFIQSPPPSPTVTADNGEITINSAYLPWHRQDQLLLGWIRSSLSESILSQVVSCETSRELWTSLQQSFASASRARVIDLKRQLQHATRGSSTCTEYLAKMRQLADELAFIGSPIPTEELINNIISGLGSEYNPFFASIAAASRHESFTFSDLQGLLLGFESLLRSQTPSSSSLNTYQPPSAYATGTYTPNVRSGSSQYQYQPRSQYQSQPRPRGYQPRVRPPYQYNPTTSPPTNTGNPRFAPKPVYQNNNFQTMPQRPPRPSSSQVAASTKQFCQICNKFGFHTAKQCWFRYDEDSSWTPPTASSASSTNSASPQAYVASATPEPSTDWILDSGASSHVTSDVNNLSAFYSYGGPDSLQIGNGMGLTITHIGNFNFSLSGTVIHLNNVLVVPSFSKNLISISQLLTDNPHLLIEFSSNSCFFKDLLTKAIILQVNNSKGLFCLTSSVLPQVYNVSRASPALWHARLGHPSSATTSKVLNMFSLPSTAQKLDNCQHCALAKSHVLPFNLSVSSSTKPLQLIHSDVWGPSPIVSSNAFRYYIIFVDDYTKYTWIYFMVHKHEVVNIFSLFKQQVENQFNTNIQTLRTDGGTEFKPIATKFPQIIHQLTCPYTPQQNGVSERKHRHIIELSLAMISTASIPHMYWDEIFSSAVYLINRLPSSANSQIPYTTLFNQSPDYSFLRVIGCLCFPHTRHYNSHKLQLRSLPCVFLGYATSQKGYRCLHIDTNRIYTSRSVQFDELIFPFAAHSNGSSRLTEEDESSLPGPPLLDLYMRGISQSQPNNHSPPPVSPVRRAASPVSQPTTPTATPIPGQPLSHSIPPTQPISSNCDITFQQTPNPANTALPPSPSLPPTTSHPMITRTRDHTRKPRHFPDHVAYLTSLALTEPTSFSQANQHLEWRMAMAKEIDALAVNQTWQLVPPPSDQRVVGCKWVYKLKRKSDGTIERHKARLVAKGYHQQDGIDVFDTFSPVVRPTTVRLILSLAVSSHWPIHQLDVQNAFLHGDLSETVYMSQPPGFVDSAHPNHVCLLKKSIYGLKQSPRAWFQKLSSTLIQFGFTPSKYDPSLFLAHCNGHTTIVLVYVDDILVTGSNQHHVNSCISQLHSRFAIKDLGLLHYFLGISVTSNATGLHLSQAKYIHDILSRTNMLNAKPVSTPIATDISLFPTDSEPFSDPHLYRSTVGALQYATVTRPDLSYAVNKLSQFMHSPTLNHWSAVKRVLRYLCGTMDHGLQIHANSISQLHAYTDSDWAGSHFDRRSTSGFSIFLGNNLISWSAKKQHTVSRSSTEAEYRGLAITCTELLWVQFLLQELHVSLSSPPVMWCDNIGATFLASNPMFHSRTKHVEIDFHFVREKVAAKTLLVRYLCSADQLADIMTKPLSTARFQFLRHKLNVTPVPLACGGGVEQHTGAVQ
ncbi:hypothetical protein LUZ61_015923 [Rhynchospora tenuis]|uniref:Integrase catalytic domain-containing protein n=1 Tax=Rhynchospora tenuis TaxID=198213 RepID=A0AAD5Z4J7_9POAL|nr:hypothetical protein LUZ61_015923 [Rhynchospora tenuis]